VTNSPSEMTIPLSATAKTVSARIAPIRLMKYETHAGCDRDGFPDYGDTILLAKSDKRQNEETDDYQTGQVVDLDSSPSMRKTRIMTLQCPSRLMWSRRKGSCEPK
jgi:hypothetical protein